MIIATSNEISIQFQKWLSSYTQTVFAYLYQHVSVTKLKPLRTTVELNH